MPPNDSLAALRAARAQAAVMRTLASELQRNDPGAADGLMAQAVEESARLVSAVEGLSQARSSHPPALPASHAEGSKKGRGRVPHVLVVDDDDASRVAIARGLAPEYEVTTACNGLEGLEAAAGTRFDAIVTDIRMPEMDGVTMVDRIRARYAGASVPVVFLTGETAPERVAASFSAGGTSYLVKPTDLDLLDEELRWLLDDGGKE